MIDDFKKKRAYWQYQYLLGKDYLIPLLREWGMSLANLLVVDIGCAEGGILCALADEGASGLGLEIIPSRLEFAIRFAQPNHREKISFITADFFFSPINSTAPKPDLILLRDVIEHLPPRHTVMEKLQQMMAPASKLMITFPPFYAPFGGHQQMLKGFLRMIPYFHAAPKPIWGFFRWYISRFDGNPKFLGEMEKLRNHRISIHNFRKLAKSHHFRIIKERFYISRPGYQMRFGWPVIKAKLLCRIPILRELIISGAFFLLESDEE